MAKVLITGASGFVGREVVATFKRAGLEVTGMCRTDPQLDVEVLRCDLSNEKELASVLHNRKFDRIIHVASLPGDTGVPRDMVKVNINGLQNILEYAREIGKPRFVLASSISAYEWYPATPFNPPDYLPVDEDHPCRPKDIYSTTKRMQEILTLTYYHQYGVPATALRLTAVIGPRGKGGGRGWREIAVQLGRPGEVALPHFSAEEICHYVDIRDVARQMLSASEHPGAVGEVFNCCGPRAVSGAEFAETVQEIFPKAKPTFGFPWSMAQGGKIEFDMSKAQRLIGYAPEYDLRASLMELKNWIDSGGLSEQQAKTERFGGGVHIDNQKE